MREPICEEQPSPSTTLPHPQFSSSNPYWQKLEIPGVNPQCLPQLSWRDFLYANVWEMNKLDPHLAHCVRYTQQLTVRLNFWFSIRNQLKEIRNEAKSN